MVRTQTQVFQSHSPLPGEASGTGVGLCPKQMENGLREGKASMEPLTQAEKDDVRVKYYKHVHIYNKGRNEPRWRGIHLLKFPTDLILYAEKIFELKPDYIVEAGTAYGGSAMFFADMLTLSGGKKVFSIDVNPKETPPHPMVEYIIGSSTDMGIVAKVRDEVKNDKVMVVLDSNHSTRHVRNELRRWNHVVTPGQYMVVEDCYTRAIVPYKPFVAVEWFLGRVNNFKLDPVEERFLVAVTRHGWLRKI